MTFSNSLIWDETGEEPAEVLDEAGLRQIGWVPPPAWQKLKGFLGKTWIRAIIQPLISYSLTTFVCIIIYLC